MKTELQIALVSGPAYDSLYDRLPKFTESTGIKVNVAFSGDHPSLNHHLATLAAASGNTAEAIRLIEQVTVIDSEGHWAERASMLRSSLPPVSPAPGKDGSVEQAAPAVKLK